MNNNIENVNLWESNYSEKCTFFKTFEELISFIEKNNKELVFTLHDKQLPNQDHKCRLDTLADRDNISITYTDIEHPIVILNKLGNKILVNPTFYEQNKEKFKEYARKKLDISIEEAKKSIFPFIGINDYLIDDSLIDFLISSEDLREISISFYKTVGQELTEEQINKLKSAHLEVNYNNKSISTKYVVGKYTISELNKKEEIILTVDLTDEEINNFNYINDNTIITIVESDYTKDEKTYFEKLIKIFKALSTHNRNYNIKINVKNRELLKQSNLLILHKNINLLINNDHYNYSKEEYLKEEDILEKLVKPIKESNLSPYEKYLAVYNIVKQFKPYKENEEDKNQSRDIRYILNNEYMVCVGYAKLLKTLLDKVGIPSIRISVGVDTSYDDGFTK